MADEYINKGKLLEQIRIDSACREGQYGDEWMFMDTITDMPTIEIVHCGECKHYTAKEYLCDFMQNTEGDDWFCADGERK